MSTDTAERLFPLFTFKGYPLEKGDELRYGGQQAHLFGLPCRLLDVFVLTAADVKLTVEMNSGREPIILTEDIMAFDWPNKFYEEKARERASEKLRKVKPAMTGQVGGTHYAAKYQHWDWVCDLHVPYLEACATKYLMRWREKNGLQDLQKAKHFMEKALELYDREERRRGWRWSQRLFDLMCDDYHVAGHEIHELDWRTMELCAKWNTRADIEAAIRAIQDRIEENEE